MVLNSLSPRNSLNDAQTLSGPIFRKKKFFTRYNFCLCYLRYSLIKT